MEEELWSNLLRETSKKSRAPDSTCVILGESVSRKRILMDCWTDIKTNENTRDNRGGDYDLVESYTYFDTEDGLSEAEASSRVNVWSMRSQCLQCSLEVILSRQELDKLAFVICLDAAAEADECMKSLQINLASILAYVESLPSDISSQLQVSNRSYVSSARRLVSNSVSEDQATDDHSDVVGVLPLETFRTDDLGISRNMRNLQGRLRQVCVQTGSALAFSPTTHDPTASRMKKYLLHRLYPELIPFSPDWTVEDSWDRCFIPSGFDSQELVTLSTGFGSNTMDLRTILEVSGTSSRLENTKDTTETEDLWLQSLQDFIKQAGDGSAAPSSRRTIAVDATTSIQTTAPPVTDAVVSNSSDSTAQATTARPSRRASSALDPKKMDTTSFFSNLLNQSAGGTPASGTSAPPPSRRAQADPK